MSTKTFPHGGPDNIAPFLIISFVIHMVLTVALGYLGPVERLLFGKTVHRRSEPVVVDVVELPPSPAEKPRGRPKIFSERSNRAEKETVPETKGPSGAFTAGRIPPRQKVTKHSVKRKARKAETHKPATKGAKAERSTVRPAEVPPLKAQSPAVSIHPKAKKKTERAEKPERKAAKEPEKSLQPPKERAQAVIETKTTPPPIKGPEPVKKTPVEEKAPQPVKTEPVTVSEMLKRAGPLAMRNTEKPRVSIPKRAPLEKKTYPAPAEREIKEKSPIAEQPPLLEMARSTVTAPEAVKGEPAPAENPPERTVQEKAPLAAEDKSAPESAPPTVVQAPSGPKTPSKAQEKKRPDLFLSNERIAQLVEEYKKAPPKRERGKRLQLNTSELRFAKYMLDVKRKIYLKWEYPLSAIRERQQGKLRINFKIRRDGKLVELKLIKSSNYPVLDDAALTAIRLADFSPFPDNIEVESIEIHATFEYILHQIGPR